MFRHQLVSAFRNLWKNRIFSLINILGLSIGLSASIVIAMVIYSENTFDTHHQDLDKMYRISATFTFNNEPFYTAGIPSPLKREIKTMSGVESAVGFFQMTIPKVKTPQENLFKNVGKTIFTQSEYFDFFSYKWLTNKPKNILGKPNEIILTEKRANKYFPNTSIENVVGKTLTYNDSIIVTVTGVVADITERSDLIFQEFISEKTAKYFGKEFDVIGDESAWGSVNSGNQLFVKLANENSLASLQTQLKKSIELHKSKDEDVSGQRYEIQPFSDLHFEAKGGFFQQSGAFSKKTLKSLMIIAIFLLVLGCINFINLSTAQSTKRYKEVGVKKTLGSNKISLIYQFILESFILTFCAGICSILFSAFLIKKFKSFLTDEISFSLFSEPIMILVVIGLLIIIAILSGFYPALVLSKFKPVSILKNQLFTGSNNGGLRKTLTVFQFVVAQVFIIGTLLVGKQINYMLNKDLGFNPNARAYVSMRSFLTEDLSKHEAFRHEISKISGVKKLALAAIPPASNGIYMRTMHLENEKEKEYTISVLYGDTNFLNNYQIPIIAGRNIANDTITECVINEKLMKKLGFSSPEEVIGKRLDDHFILEIVGVMKDFNQRSLKSEIRPMLYMGDQPRGKYTNFNNLHFTFSSQNSEDWKPIIKQIGNIFTDVYGEDEFKISFVDDDIEQFYKEEQKTATLLQWATGLTILISCLGLFGLVIYTTERRVKEIGIRKVLGATVPQLSVLLTKEFLILVGIAFVLAVPIAWYGIDYWLKSFTFKTSVTWWIFGIGGILIFVTALAVIFSKVWLASKQNPVESLRSE